MDRKLTLFQSEQLRPPYWYHMFIPHFFSRISTDAEFHLISLNPQHTSTSASLLDPEEVWMRSEYNFVFFSSKTLCLHMVLGFSVQDSLGTPTANQLGHVESLLLLQYLESLAQVLLGCEIKCFNLLLPLLHWWMTNCRETALTVAFKLVSVQSLQKKAF